MEPEAVLSAARIAKDNGSTRFCMGAAWREIPDGPAFDAVLLMVRDVAALGMEVCTTLGMLTAEQAGGTPGYPGARRFPREAAVPPARSAWPSA